MIHSTAKEQQRQKSGKYIVVLPIAMHVVNKERFELSFKYFFILSLANRVIIFNNGVTKSYSARTHKVPLRIKPKDLVSEHISFLLRVFPPIQFLL